MKTKLHKAKSDEGEKLAWTVSEWGHDTRQCNAKVYQLINEGQIRTAKVGAKRLILTSPRSFLEAHAVPTGTEAA